MAVFLIILPSRTPSTYHSAGHAVIKAVIAATTAAAAPAVAAAKATTSAAAAHIIRRQVEQRRGLTAPQDVVDEIIRQRQGLRGLILVAHVAAAAAAATATHSPVVCGIPRIHIPANRATVAVTVEAAIVAISHVRWKIQ